MAKLMELLRNCEIVIPANAGIQGHDSGFRVPLRGPGMTMREIVIPPEFAP